MAFILNKKPKKSRMCSQLLKRVEGVAALVTNKQTIFGWLVCDLLLRGGRGLSPECALPEEYLGHNLDEHSLEQTEVVWCLAYPGGVVPLYRVLRFQIIRET